MVLRTGRFREADLWVRFLSPSKGMVTAFAFGACRSRRRFGGCLEPLNHVLATVTASKCGEYLYMEEGTLLSCPVRLRKDWGRMGLVANCIKFVEAMGIGHEGAAEAYRVLCDTLKLLETAQSVPEMLPLLFRTRFAFDHGYKVDPLHCAHCGSPLAHAPYVSFLPREGVMLCHRHAGGERGIVLSCEALDAVRFVQETPPPEWSTIPLSLPGRKLWGRAMDAFIQHHVGLVWEKGRFRKV